MLAEIRAEAERIAGDLAAIRRHLHQNPELSYKEVNTSAYLSRLLSEWGIKHRIGVGGHGIVADLGPAGKSPKVAFRADMDALPIQEQVQIPFCSTVPGVAHLCGHDAHVAMALGAVRILQKQNRGGRRSYPPFVATRRGTPAGWRGGHDSGRRFGRD